MGVTTPKPPRMDAPAEWSSLGAVSTPGILFKTSLAKLKTVPFGCVGVKSTYQ